MKRYYKDFYGATASIEEKKDGTAILRTSVAGSRTKKTYNSFRGAKIALGRMSDCWKESK